MPSTSEVRRSVFRTSARFLSFPPAPRPAHLPPTTDRRRLGLGREACNALEPLVPPAWPEPWGRTRAAVHLKRWTVALGHIVADSSSSGAHEEVLTATNERTLELMNRWLRGEWSERDALVEMLWRLEVGDRCVAAALWLHDLAVAGCDQRMDTGDAGTPHRRA